MKLKSFQLERFPYWEREPLHFAEEHFGEGIHLIVGPNGVGKTTVCRALQALLWPEILPKAAPLSLSSRWEQDGSVFSLSRNEFETRCDFPHGRLELPPVRFAPCYFSSIEELLLSEDRSLANEIAREMTGGFDVGEIENDPLFSLGRFHGRSEWKEVIGSQRALRDLARSEARWEKERVVLEQLKSTLQELTVREQGQEKIKKALEILSLEQKLAECKRVLSLFPEQLHAMNGKEELLFTELCEREKHLQARLEEIALAIASSAAEEEIDESLLLSLEALARRIEEEENKHKECLKNIARCENAIEQVEKTLGVAPEQLRRIDESNLLCSQKQWQKWKELKQHIASLQMRLMQLKTVEQNPEELEAVVLEHCYDRSLRAFPIRELIDCAVFIGGALYLAKYQALLLSFALGAYALVRAVEGTVHFGKKCRVRKRLKKALSYDEAKEQWALALRSKIDALYQEQFEEEKRLLDAELEQLEKNESACIEIGEIIAADLASHLIEREGFIVELRAWKEEEKKLHPFLTSLYCDFAEKLPASFEKPGKSLSLVQAQIAALRQMGDRTLLKKEKALRLKEERLLLEEKLQRLLAEKRAFLEPFEGKATLLFSCIERWEEHCACKKQIRELESSFASYDRKEFTSLLEKSREELVEQIEPLAEQKEKLLIEITKKERDLEEGKRSLQKEEREKELIMSREKLYVRFEETLFAKGGKLLLEEAQKSLVEETEPEVYRIADRFFTEFTRGEYRFLCPRRGGKEFFCRENASSRVQSVKELSTATKMQLLLAVRLAFAEVHEMNGVSLPLFCDEALTTSDSYRLSSMIDAFAHIAKKRQVFYFTASSEEEKLWRKIADDRGVTFNVIKIAAEREKTAMRCDFSYHSIPLAPILEEEKRSLLARNGLFYLYQLQNLIETGKGKQWFSSDEISTIEKKAAFLERCYTRLPKVKRGDELITIFTSLNVPKRYYSPLIELYRKVRGEGQKWLFEVKERKHPGLKGMRKEVYERLYEYFTEDTHSDQEDLSTVIGREIQESCLPEKDARSLINSLFEIPL